MSFIAEIILSSLENITDIYFLLMYSAFYLRSGILRVDIFEEQMRLADPRTAKFTEFFFTIGSFIVNFAEFVFAMDNLKGPRRE